MKSPVFNQEEGFSQQLKRNIDRPLILGSTMFGIGWALVGFCPGPVIAALTLVDGNVFIFFISMSIGMLIKKEYSKFDLFALKEHLLFLYLSLCCSCMCFVV